MSSETAWGLSVVVVYAAILVWQGRGPKDPDARRNERLREQAERAAQRRFW